MKQVVYIDVLFVINLFVNYLILITTAKLMRISSSRWRLLGGAALGGIYALLIFTPVIHIAYTLAAKLLFSLSIVLASFKDLNLKQTIKAMGCFYGVNFAFAGAMFALWMSVKPKGMVIHNGIVYFDISVVTLVITAIIVFFLLKLIGRLSKRHAPDTHKYKLTVSMNGCEITTEALLDTGNSLTDAFSDTPVIVAEYQTLQALFPPQLELFFQGKENRSIYQMDKEWSRKIRLIPFFSMGGEGLLPAFRPDHITIQQGRDTIVVKKVLVAVCRGRLPRSEYGALLNPDLINEKEKVVALT